MSIDPSAVELVAGPRGSTEFPKRLKVKDPTIWPRHVSASFTMRMVHVRAMFLFRFIQTSFRARLRVAMVW